MKAASPKLKKTFSFDKETIIKLTSDQMSALAGGKGAGQNEMAQGYSCAFSSCNSQNAELR